jgi:hypothetical protein
MKLGSPQGGPSTCGSGHNTPADRCQGLLTRARCGISVAATYDVALQNSLYGKNRLLARLAHTACHIEIQAVQEDRTMTVILCALAHWKTYACSEGTLPPKFTS